MFSTLLAVVLVVTLTESRPAYFTGKHFRVGFRENPIETFTQVNAQNETIIRGSAIDMLKWISQRSNFTYTLVLCNYTAFNNLPVTFRNNSLDLYLINAGLVHGRNYIAKYLFPYFVTGYSVLIPYPQKEANVYAAVLPYTKSVWVCFFASMVVVSYLLKRFARAKKYIYQQQGHDSFLTYGGTILYVVGVATNQGAACFSKARIVRLLAGIWCLAAVVMVNAYSGSLITYMTTPRLTPLINSLQDVANKSAPQIITTSSSFFRAAADISPAHKPFGDNMKKLPPDFCGLITSKSHQHCVQLVKEGGHVFVIDKWAVSLELDQNFKSARSCGLTSVPAGFSGSYGGWVLPLNSPHEVKNAIDVFLLEAVSYGLADYWESSYVNVQGFCKNYKILDQSIRKLSLKDFASAFVILGAGIVLSLTVFAYEVLKGRLLPKAYKKPQNSVHGVKSSNKPLGIADT